MTKPRANCHRLRNIGPRSAEWLAEAGIHSRDDLEQIGVVAAYALVRRQHAGVSLNLLWSLEGALRDIDWRELSDDVKQQLLSRLEQLTSQ